MILKVMVVLHKSPSGRGTNPLVDTWFDIASSIENLGSEGRRGVLGVEEEVTQFISKGYSGKGV